MCGVCFFSSFFGFIVDVFLIQAITERHDHTPTQTNTTRFKTTSVSKSAKQSKTDKIFTQKQRKMQRKKRGKICKNQHVKTVTKEAKTKDDAQTENRKEEKLVQKDAQQHQLERAQNNNKQTKLSQLCKTMAKRC